MDLCIVSNYEESFDRANNVSIVNIGERLKRKKKRISYTVLVPLKTHRHIIHKHSESQPQ